MLHIVIVAGILACAVQAIRSFRLLAAALWLAGTSALVSLEMYLLGAVDVAVIELSVGAGLVTVLFVFAMNLTGHEKLGFTFVVPEALAWVLLGMLVLVLGWLVLPALPDVLPAVPAGDFRTVLWQDRKLDLYLQVVLVFAGVLGVIGFLGRASKENKQ